MTPPPRPPRAAAAILHLARQTQPPPRSSASFWAPWSCPAARSPCSAAGSSRAGRPNPRPTCPTKTPGPRRGLPTPCFGSTWFASSPSSLCWRPYTWPLPAPRYTSSFPFTLRPSGSTVSPATQRMRRPLARPIRAAASPSTRLPTTTTFSLKWSSGCSTSHRPACLAAFLGRPTFSPR